MLRGVHGEKLVAAHKSDKLPKTDKDRLEKAIKRYDDWIENINNIENNNFDERVSNLVKLLNEYKFYVDVNLIFDSENDFLYRQKGQLKIDNTVVEEFLPLFIKKCFAEELRELDIDITSQAKTFSSLYFTATIEEPNIGGGMQIKSKDQDFSISRKLYLKSSYSKDFKSDNTIEKETSLGFVMAEIKTNLDKTMFQEACATAKDVKIAVTGSKYYLLCDYLDMKPISTDTTDIDEILILRKAKRINSNIRKSYSKFEGRRKARNDYIKYLKDNPYSVDVFKRLALKIGSSIKGTGISLDEVLKNGYF